VLAGYDQKSNVVLSDSKERVYSMDEGVEEVPLGLYLVKGDMMCVFPHHVCAHCSIVDHRPSVIVSVSQADYVPLFFFFSASSLARLMKNATVQLTSLLFVPNPSHPFDTKGTPPPESFPLFPTFPPFNLALNRGRQAHPISTH
jgi:hypothetical protein